MYIISGVVRDLVKVIAGAVIYSGRQAETSLSVKTQRALKRRA